MNRNRNRRKVQAGFSLVELLIVITIIGIIIAVAVPKTLDMLRSGRESGAIQNLRTMNNNQALYHSRHGKYATLKELVDEKLLDGSYASGQSVKGYIFTSTEADGAQYCIQATRENGGSGFKDFNITEDGIIRFSEGKSPTPLPYGEGTSLSAAK